MNSTPILPIYVQLCQILTVRHLETFPLNQPIASTELPLPYSHLPLIENSCLIVSSITLKWVKPVALTKSLAKNYKCWVMPSLITFLTLQRRAFMIAISHRNGRQHKSTVSTKKVILRIVEIIVQFHF